jgi:uncharacterized repeat protein (TIGR03803 family)
MKILGMLLTLALLGCTAAISQAQLTTIYSFSGSPGGASPVDKLLFDRVGNLYGTTEWGGAYGWGSIFELSPNGDGTWAETTLYSFCATNNGHSCNDGSQPLAALIFDSAGNLYGTTSSGSDFYCGDNSEGCGTAFELSPPGMSGDAWTYSVIYYFCSNNEPHCPDGAEPSGKVTFDTSGNLYGTTPLGGENGRGVVFELSQGLGGWTESVIYSFCSQGNPPACPDGSKPAAGVAFDKEGNLYGTTSAGGSPKYPGSGVVYKLTPGQSGWTEQILYAFLNGAKGGTLLGEVNFNSAGNIYSTAESGGADAQGVVFRLTPKGLQEISFQHNVTGAAPTAGVLIDPRNGDVYGTTSGDDAYFGSVYRVRGGKMTVLGEFNVGDNPMGALVTDGHHLYGTTKAGGDFNMGSVFEVGP